jgi:death on curing protein
MMPVYLTVAQVVEIHARMVSLYGGREGLRDAAALEAAVARPRSGYYFDVIEEAAAFFESLSQNHPFLDDNKRTAIAATIIFLTCNGYEISFTDASAYDWLMGLHKRKQLNKRTVDSWLREHSYLP